VSKIFFPNILLHYYEFKLSMLSSSKVSYRGHFRVFPPERPQIWSD